MLSADVHDDGVLLLRKALLLARGIPGFNRVVNPIRRRYARVTRVVTVDDFDGDLKMRLALDERDFLVLKVGRSPFPGDDRPCAFAEPA